MNHTGKHRSVQFVCRVGWSNFDRFNLTCKFETNSEIHYIVKVVLVFKYSKYSHLISFFLCWICLQKNCKEICTFLVTIPLKDNFDRTWGKYNLYVFVIVLTWFVSIGALGKQTDFLLLFLLGTRYRYSDDISYCRCYMFCIKHIKHATPLVSVIFVNIFKTKEGVKGYKTMYSKLILEIL
jgi:hypothetical protein